MRRKYDAAPPSGSGLPATLAPFQGPGTRRNRLSSGAGAVRQTTRQVPSSSTGVVSGPRPAKLTTPARASGAPRSMKSAKNDATTATAANSTTMARASLAPWVRPADG